MHFVRMAENHHYHTSKDYPHLWQLLQKTPIICILDFETSRDVASTIFYRGLATVSVRGCCYLHAENENEFVAHCERLNLEFIDSHQGNS